MARTTARRSPPAPRGGESLRARRTLTSEVQRLAIDMGADLVGIAPAERFDGAPRGHHPRDWLPACRSVVVAGIRQLEAVHDWPWMMQGTPLATEENRLAILQEYWFSVTNHDVHDGLLDQIALRVALHLQRRGYASVFHEAATLPTLSPLLTSRLREPHHALFSHRHAAVRAGLGEFGLNNLVITPEHGPYVRFVSVLTAASLIPNDVLDRKVCLGVKCGLCLDLCGGEVLKLGPEATSDKVWIDPPVRTDRSACVERRKTEFCRGQCLARCPVGRPLRATRKRARTARTDGGAPAMHSLEQVTWPPTSARDPSPAKPGVGSSKQSRRPSKRSSGGPSS
jgi:epoxyqueuosine reductase